MVVEEDTFEIRIPSCELCGAIHTVSRRSENNRERFWTVLKVDLKHTGGCKNGTKSGKNIQST